MRKIAIATACFVFVTQTAVVVYLLAALYTSVNANGLLAGENARLKADAKGWADVVKLIDEKWKCNQATGRGSVGEAP